MFNKLCLLLLLILAVLTSSAAVEEKAETTTLLLSKQPCNRFISEIECIKMRQSHVSTKRRRRRSSKRRRRSNKNKRIKNIWVPPSPGKSRNTRSLFGRGSRRRRWGTKLFKNLNKKFGKSPGLRRGLRRNTRPAPRRGGFFRV